MTLRNLLFTQEHSDNLSPESVKPYIQELIQKYRSNYASFADYFPSVDTLGDTMDYTHADFSQESTGQVWCN